MSKAEKIRDKARALESRDPKGAVDAWLDVLKIQEDEGDPNPDLSVYNRIGDLFLKLKDPGQAADYYERGVDKYAELGFHNNAIALCNKVLRNAPGRPSTYLKLAKLYAAKGFLAEARQHFVEYAERMKKAGNLEHAFAALKQFTDLSPESESLRRQLEEHLKAYGGPQRRPSRVSVAAEAPTEPKSPKRKTSSLVFLDLDEPRRPSGQPAKPAAPAPPAAPVATAAPPTAGEELEVERTSVEEAGAPEGGALDGLESTSLDFTEVRRSATDIPAIRDDVGAPPAVAPLADLEPTAGEPAVEEPAIEEPLVEEPVIELDVPPGAPPSPPPAPPKRKTVVEVPPLELEPDFESAGAAAHEVDDQPLAAADDVGEWIVTEDQGASDVLAGGRDQGFIDLGLEGVVNAEADASVLEFVPPSIEELEARVAENPGDPDAHWALAEALVEAGERERGIEELDHAAAGYDTAGRTDRAAELIEGILRLDPNSVRHRQKAVELAFKAGDKSKLIDAYLELADSLLRTNLPDKARAVYERVAEHDPGNTRAQAALSMLAPAPAAAAPEGRVDPKDARMRVRDEATADTGDFVDLGALVLEEEPAPRDTRMKVEDEEPTGDEERDFQEMLSRFKQGIDENIDEADFQSHYDLGVAFKEMGLLDEAISEFQKALRAPEGKLRTTEALGVCFFEKGAFGVAESILRRGLELQAAGDQERLGVLYWLGRAFEEQGKTADARDVYGRVFAVDIRFMDVGGRVKALGRA
jgi:tetratricopeptide (TPR) repeat protein